MSSGEFNNISFSNEENGSPQGPWLLSHPQVSLMSPMASSWSSHPEAGATVVFCPSLSFGAQAARTPTCI